MSAFITGFSLGLSLILAIGAQNVFVLRQGLKRQHVSAVVLFCATSDAALIAAGVGGLGLVLAPVMAALSDWLFAGAALWLPALSALFIGTIGAISVFKAVYIDKRELKCACVGGDSNVPLGVISLTENLMMMGMAIWMMTKPFI